MTHIEENEEAQAKIWILLADTRKKLLWLWLAFTTLILAILFLMTLNGKLVEAEGATWSWASICLLPMLSLLFIGVARNAHPSKAIKKAHFWLIYALAFGYLISTLFTLLGLQGWLMSHTEEGDGISRYFSETYLWLMPFEILLLIGAGFLYFQKTPLFQPNEKILMGYAQKKAEYAQRFGNKNQLKGFDLLIKNDFEQLFSFLTDTITDKSEQTLNATLQSRYSFVKQHKDFNTADPKELQIELNKITMGLIDVIEEL